MTSAWVAAVIGAASALLGVVAGGLIQFLTTKQQIDRAHSKDRYNRKRLSYLTCLSRFESLENTVDDSQISGIAKPGDVSLVGMASEVFAAEAAIWLDGSPAVCSVFLTYYRALVDAVHDVDSHPSESFSNICKEHNVYVLYDTLKNEMRNDLDHLG
jgi:hypothetical protein